MFFDDMDQDNYRSIILNIACKQKELFSYHFHWRERTPLQGGAAEGNSRSYQKVLEEWNVLRKEAENACAAKGITRGFFWWNLPWEVVERYLICDLIKTKENGKWRFGYQWKLLKDGAMRRIVLLETGHYSDFSSARYHTYAEESNYSAREQMDMLDQFNRKIDRSIFLDKLSDTGPVRSVSSGEIYESKRDYYDSLEFYTDRQFYTDVYKRSLYTVRETDEVQVVSNSRHYDCVFDIAEYLLTKSGQPEQIRLLWFQQHGGSGDVPSDLRNKYEDVDVAVELAAQLHDSPEITSVPADIMGADMERASATFDEAIRQAEMYTCLAEKLV